jgi:hypothetical protein
MVDAPTASQNAAAFSGSHATRHGARWDQAIRPPQTTGVAHAPRANLREARRDKHALAGKNDGSMDDLIGPVWVHARDIAADRQRQRG